MSEQQMVLAVNQASTANLSYADSVYQNLRTALRERVKELVDKGAAFVQTDRVVKRASETFRLTLPNDTHGVYKCHTCSRFFDQFDRLGYITDQGGVRNVLAEVYNDVLGGEYKTRTTTVAPFKFLDGLTVDTTGEWKHFYAFTPEELLALKKRHDYDFSIGDILIKEFFSRKVDLATAEQLLANLEVAAVNDGSLNPLRQWVEFLKIRPKAHLTKETAAALANDTRFEFLKWIRTTAVYSRFIAHFTTGTTEPTVEMLMKNVDEFNRFVDPTAYKRKQVEASTQALQNMIDELTAMGLPRALERRVASVDELKVMWERAQEEPAMDTDAEPENLMASIVAKKIKELSTGEVSKASPDAYLSLPVRAISMKGFRSELEGADRVIYLNGNGFCGFFTAPVVTDAPHTKLFDGDENGVFPVSYNNEFSFYAAAPLEIDSIMDTIAYGGKETVLCMFSQGIRATVMDNVPLTEGSLIVGGSIHSHLNHLTRAIQEVSRQIPLQMPSETDKPSTWVRLALGSQVVIVKNGIMSRYEVTSVD